MAAFGVIVSPARAYTLPTAPGAAGRLHLTQVSLDGGPDDRTVTVRVTLGEKPPIIIARLLPRHSESLHLDLRYNLSQEVTFSVFGPRSVHLAGYFDGLPDLADSESFGEDIAHSDSQQKSGGDSEYGGSFINDSDPGYSSPSSADSSFKANGLPDDPKMMPKGKKSRRRRLRKVHVVESNTDSSGTSGGGASVSVVPDSDDDFEFFGDSLLKKKEHLKAVIRPIVPENDLEADKSASPRPMKAETASESLAKKKKKCVKKLDVSDNEQSLEAVEPEPVTLHSPKNSEEVDVGLKVTKKKQLVKDGEEREGDVLRSKKGKRKKHEENDAIATQPNIPLHAPAQSSPAKTEDESKKKKKKKKQRAK